MPSKGYFPSFLIFSYCHDICNNVKTTRKEIAAAGDGLGQQQGPLVCTSTLGFSAKTPPRDCGRHRKFPVFPVLGQPMSDVTVYFCTVIICNKLGTRGAGGRAEPLDFLSRTFKTEKQLR